MTEAEWLVAFALAFPRLAAWLYFVYLAPDASAGANRLMQVGYGGAKVV